MVLGVETADVNPFVVLLDLGYLFQVQFDYVAAFQGQVEDQLERLIVVDQEECRGLWGHYQ